MFRCPRCGAFNRVPAHRPAGEPVCGKCRSPLDLSGKPQEVDGQALERAISSSPIPVVVDFWAPWCAPCRMVAPALEAVARSAAGRVLVLKLNTQDDPAAGARHGVQAIPTFVAFEGGQEVDRQSGAMPQPMLADWVGRVGAPAA